MKPTTLLTMGSLRVPYGLPTGSPRVPHTGSLRVPRGHGRHGFPPGHGLTPGCIGLAPLLWLQTARGRPGRAGRVGDGWELINDGQSPNDYYRAKSVMVMVTNDGQYG